VHRGLYFGVCSLVHVVEYVLRCAGCCECVANCAVMCTTVRCAVKSVVKCIEECVPECVEQRSVSCNVLSCEMEYVQEFM
jgi:hypothetical protein